jgi:hypothetical protein
MVDGIACYGKNNENMDDEDFGTIIVYRIFVKERLGKLHPHSNDFK